jgi:hypothetical protein
MAKWRKHVLLAVTEIEEIATTTCLEINQAHLKIKELCY